MLSAKEVAQRYFEEVWTRRRREAIAELSAPYAVGHLAFGGTKHVIDVQSFHDAICTACPDFQLAVEQLVGEGEHVAVRWLARGTHQRDAFGITAKNRAFELRGVTWLRVRDGKIIEAWDCFDETGLLAKWAE